MLSKEVLSAVKIIEKVPIRLEPKISLQKAIRIEVKVLFLK